MKFISALIGLFFCSFSFSSENITATQANDFLASWLTSHVNYKLAEKRDCQCLDALKEQPKNYEPYKNIGDFDGDEKNDVAVIVIDRKNTKNFLLLVFASRFGGKSPIVYGNIFDSNLAGLALFTNSGVKGKKILLFGAFDSEAEPIHIPLEVPERAT